MAKLSLVIIEKCVSTSGYLGHEKVVLSAMLSIRTMVITKITPAVIIITIIITIIMKRFL